MHSGIIGVILTMRRDRVVLRVQEQSWHGVTFSYQEVQSNYVLWLGLLKIYFESVYKNDYRFCANVKLHLQPYLQIEFQHLGVMAQQKHPL